MDTFNGEKLIIAAISGSTAEVDKILKIPTTNINYKNSKGDTALHSAAMMGRFNVVKLLLDKGADANLLSNSHCSVLHRACEYGHTEIARLILQKSRDNIDLANAEGFTAIQLAGLTGNADLWNLLREHDATTLDSSIPVNNAPIQEEMDGGEDGQKISSAQSVDPAVLKHALQQGSKEWRRSKFSVVGEGRAGKTALVNAIVGRAFAETSSTVGINQLTCDVKQVRASGAGEGDAAGSASNQQQWGECSRVERELETALAEIVLHNRKQPPASMEGGGAADKAGRSQKGCILSHMQATQTLDTQVNNSAAEESIALKVTSNQAADLGSGAPLEDYDEGIMLKALATLSDEQTGLLISLFDFGGQAVFDVIHHLFLTRNGVYALVFNMEWLTHDGPEKGKALRFMRNWLSSIVVHTFDKATGSAAPIVFVGTRLDLVSSPAEHETISTLLYEEFSDNLAWRSVLENENGHDSNGKAFQWFFAVDNTLGKDGSTMRNLMNVVHGAMDLAAYTHKQVPLTWLRTMDKLQDAGRDCLSLAEVTALGNTCGVPGREVPYLLSFLHDMGHLMWIDEPELRDVVILDPISYLVTPATIIICKLTPDKDDSTHHFIASHRECDKLHKKEWMLLKQSGVLHTKLLPILWKDYVNHTDTLLRLMVKFGLLVSLRGAAGKPTDSDNVDGTTTQYLVPTLLCPAPLDNPAVVTWTDKPCCSGYFVFTLSEDLALSTTITGADLKSSGFLPGGMFDRIIGKALSWCQATAKGSFSVLQQALLYKDMAVLTFGAQRFRLVNCADIHCVRVDVEGSNPLGVHLKLFDFILKIIDECMKSLRCFSAVRYCSDATGEVTARPDVLQKELLPSELLIPLQQLRGAGKGESMLAWRGGRTLMSMTEIKSKFGPWLQVYDLRDTYDVFISYRWGLHDSAFTEALFDMFTNFSVGEHQRAVEVFLDRKRLQDGRRFKADFAAAIIHSRVVVPVVSVAALQRMLDHQPDQVDNVLLEWILIVECASAHRVAKVFPILFGSRVVDATLTGELRLLDFFQEETKDRLPHIVPTATLAQAEKLLKENGIPPSVEFAAYTVHSIVQELLQFMLCKASDIPNVALVEAVAERAVALLGDCAPVGSNPSFASPAVEPTYATVPHATDAVHTNASVVTTKFSPARRLQDLSSTEVGLLLQSVQLEPLMELFTAHKVSGLMLSYCEEVADLLTPEYGITSKGLARGLFDKICAWKVHGVTELS